jgi:hypothetical protein
LRNEEPKQIEKNPDDDNSGEREKVSKIFQLLPLSVFVNNNFCELKLNNYGSAAKRGGKRSVTEAAMGREQDERVHCVVSEQTRAVGHKLSKLFSKIGCK